MRAGSKQRTRAVYAVTVPTLPGFMRHGHKQRSRRSSAKIGEMLGRVVEATRAKRWHDVNMASCMAADATRPEGAFLEAIQPRISKGNNILDLPRILAHT